MKASFFLQRKNYRNLLNTEYTPTNEATDHSAEVHIYDVLFTLIAGISNWVLLDEIDEQNGELESLDCVF